MTQSAPSAVQHSAPVIRGASSYHALALVEEGGAVGTWSWDLATGDIAWSPGAIALLGLALSGGRAGFADFLLVVHPDDRQDEYAERERLAHFGGAFDREVRILRRGGGIRYLRNRGEAILGPDGRPAFAVGALTDMTPLREAEAARRIAARRLEALCAAMSGCTWVADATGRILDSHEFRALASLPRDLAPLWLDAVHPQDRLRIQRGWNDALASAQPFADIHRIGSGQTADAWYRTSVRPILSDGGSVAEWVGVVEPAARPGDAQGAGHTGHLPLTGAQIRAARAILNWSVGDLASHSGVSISTIRRAEMADGPSPTLRRDRLSALRDTLEERGITFLSEPGYKPGLRPN